MAAQKARPEPQATLTEARPAARPRLEYIDNLRTFLITVVVLGHLSVTYGVDADWYYYESGEVSVLAYALTMMAVVIAVGFGMGLFFMIAGYFTPAAYDRKGFKRFLADRLKRLGIPWLVYEVVINPLVHYAVDVHGGECHGSFYDCQFQGSFWQYLAEYPRNLGSFGDGPVWFLEALLIFCIIYALWRLFAGRAPLQGIAGPAPTRPVPGNRIIALFALAVGLVTFVVRFWAKVFVYFEPWHLEFAHFPQYIALFVAGLWAYRHGWLVAFSDQQSRTWRFVLLGCVLTVPALLVAAGALSGTLDERGAGGVNLLSLFYSLWEGFLCVSMVITLLAWFRRRFDHQGRLARAMSESSMAVYILHPAIIVPLALALSGFRMNLSLKFLLVAPIAIALSYLIAYALRKLPLVRAIL
jgi:fucose 4-O-acetylase-like acetyltransferase